MPKVISRKAQYDYATLKPQFFHMMDELGGALIKPGSQVLIKPNLLAPARPDRAMLTHPLVVRAAVEYVLERRASARISDSPAMGTFEKVMKESGIVAAIEGLDVECREFKSSSSVDVGPPFHRIEIAREALDADVVINLPKLKTHGQMLLTLGVKNLFGCIVGLRKPEWHLRSGVDREMFATLLVRICRKVSPAFTILDGILAMEGQGPGMSGTPRQIGVLMGSNDPFVLDAVACRMLGLEMDRIPTNRAAARAGLLDGDVEFAGEFVRVDMFKLPEITPLVFGPRFLHNITRKHLVQRPVSSKDLCRLCGDCWKYCPAQAIAHTKRDLFFDYDKCIRCYCCQEVCPHGAINTVEPPLGRLFSRFLR